MIFVACVCAPDSLNKHSSECVCVQLGLRLFVCVQYVCVWLCGGGGGC